MSNTDPMSSEIPESPPGSPPAVTPRRALGARILSAIGYNKTFFWTTLWLLVGFVILLIPMFCAVYTNKVYMAPACLWAFAFLVAGALLGFIFGVPTVITGTLPADADTNQRVVQANTNLTQISDWFTKIIVGAGLVELGKVPGIIKRFSHDMAKGLAVPGMVNSENYAAVFSGAIIVLFSAYGFIFGYLIMRIVLQVVFED